jgi:Ni/Fe-hydrogenase subunit HybB-like protein
MVYFYFNFNEYLVPAFKMKKPEIEHLNGLFVGDFAILFWFAIIAGMLLPVAVLLFRPGRKPLPMFYMGILIVIGAWIKRFLIVTPTMLHPFLPMSNSPEEYYTYFPTWEEWAITAGSLAGALLVITFMVRIFPIIPIEETIKEKTASVL